MAHMVLVDGSENAEEAFKWVVENTPKEDRIVLLHGRELQPVLPGHAEPRKAASGVLLNKIAQNYTDLCKKNDRHCDLVTVHYGTVSELARNACNSAQEYRCKDITVGSRGLSTAQRLLMGSVSTSVVSQCKCPVNVIRGSWNKDIPK